MKDIFTSMPGSARVWIYQSDRELTPQEQEWLKTKGDAFVDQWTAHKKQLNAEIELVYNRFIIVMLDVHFNEVSGCGIDKSVNFMKEVETELGISLFDRLSIAYRDSSDAIRTVPSRLVPTLVEKGELKEQSIVFDNTVQTKDEWLTKWEAPLRHTWLAKYFRHSV